MTGADEIEASRAIDAAMARFAPQPVDAPILQPAGLYLELLGEDIRARTFTLTGPDGGEWCLRPDMTAPVVRDVLAATPGAAFAVSYDGLVFRRQTRGSIRETEFRVIGVECASPSAFSPEQEADLVAAALSAAGARPVQLRLKLGDAALAQAIVAGAGLSPAWEARIVRAFSRAGDASSVLGEIDGEVDAPDAMAEALAALPAGRAAAVVEAMLERSRAPMMGGRSAADVAGRLAAKAEAAREDRPTPEQIAAIRTALGVVGDPGAAFAALAEAAPGAKDALDRSRARWAALAPHASGAQVRFSAGFGRGPAYYDGFLFEIECAALGDRASLGGGGRYDALLHRLGAPTTWRAMGFSLRPRRVADAWAAGPQEAGR
jgi:ATP phosphoribosyltransferase regulatory subunit